ncbi:UNVERIFIED_CONTAM: hypothetical protein Q9R71_15470 [Actinomycetes bacterium ARC8]|uniref:hypothetical protein n=1 Tax=Glutamicibacter arilaitensis TaxID=256701 RepID=UPI0029376D98|nr:hypothetical protein [Actinomycetes bacterium ARC8]
MNRKLLLVVLAIFSLLLTACSPSANLQRQPIGQDQVLPSADTENWLMPSQLQGQPVFDPGWVTPPLGLDDIFFAPRENDGSLEFIAVEANGNIAWSVERPVSCTGFTLTRTSEGRALAVVSDISSTQTELTATSVTAYDLSTGEKVWGPVDVPGPHQGPGLVYAEAPEEMMGATGPKMVLNADTGQPLSLHEDEDRQIIGDYFGVVLSTADDHLKAIANHNSEPLWELEAGDLGGEITNLRADVGIPQDNGHAIVQLKHKDYALIDLNLGEVVAHGLRQARVDSITGNLILLSDQELRGTDSVGRELWGISVEADTTIIGQSHALVFLRIGDTVRVHNVVTGAIAKAYPISGGRKIIAPLMFGTSGSAVITDHSQYYLVGITPPIANEN